MYETRFIRIYVLVTNYEIAYNDKKDIPGFQASQKLLKYQIHMLSGYIL